MWLEFLNADVMKISTFVFRFFFLGCVRAAGHTVTYPQDQTSPRANTLYDDPDDIQRQLDNEARDRNKFGKLKTVWVFHLPTPFPRIRVKDTHIRHSRQIRTNSRRETVSELLEIVDDSLKWEYKDQTKWGKKFPLCDGVSQSPVDLPYLGLPKAREGRKMMFTNFDVTPSKMTLFNDGKSLTLYGEWPKDQRPIIYGGAAHSRCYVFHSLVLHWPSEHAIGGLQFPMEIQALYVASTYGSLEEALNTSLSDPLALLGVATMYRYAGETQKGLIELLYAAANVTFGSNTIRQRPLGFFQPPFNQYATYHGSLTRPPCSESVLWFIRGNALPVTRELLDAIQDRTTIGHTVQFGFRQIQRMNDRRVFLFV